MYDGISNHEKRKAVQQGIDIGILRDGSRYEGDAFYFALTNKFIDEYERHLHRTGDWEDAVRFAVMKIHNHHGKKVDTDTLAVLIQIIKLKSDSLKEMNSKLDNFVEDVEE